MAQVNVESLRVVNGVIDVDAIEVLERPFGDTNAALQRMSAVLASARSPWLVAPVGDRVDQLADEVDELVEQTDRAVAAVQLAPSMLGRDGPRTYFVAFTTPAEARGLGGFMGTWAELRADDGRLDGRPHRSDRRADGRDARRAAGARRPGRTTSPATGASAPASTASRSPSTSGRTSRCRPTSRASPRCSPSSTRRPAAREIDGAIAVDVESIARFLELTGPMQVEGPDGTDSADVERRRAVPAARPVRRDRRRRRRATPCSRRSRRS